MPTLSLSLSLSISLQCGNRSTSEADDHFLMEPVVTQARSPLIQEDGLLYQRLIVDQVTGVNGVKYDVLIIAAIDEGRQYISFVLTLDIIL